MLRRGLQMIWFLRLFAASIFAAFGFPKVLATERIWPEKPDDPAKLQEQAERSFAHNLKDDLGDWMDHDTEWWMKFFCFTIYSEAAVIAVLIVLL